MAHGTRALVCALVVGVLLNDAAALPLGLLGKGTGAPVQGVSLVNVLSQAFKPSIPKPPTEVAVPTIEWQPVTVMTPTVQVYKMGFCVPRTQWSVQPANPVDCPPQTYLQQNNGQTVCARTDCAGPVGNAAQPAAQQQKTNLLAAAYFALTKSKPQVWGASAAAVCSTIFVKPIMSCPTGCISDVRQGPDMCLCDAGIMDCPYDYQSCGCASYSICVADMYYCDYYCKYSPTWYFAMVAKGDKACPIDPNEIDPISPDPVYPGPNLMGSGVVGRRRLA